MTVSTLKVTPANLVALHGREEAVRETSLNLCADSELADHLQAVHDALDHVTVLLRVPSTPGGREHTLQLLGIRLFNSGAGALKLGLSGYYQGAFQLLRDSLELVNLLDLFRIDAGALVRWQVADDRTLKRDFGPYQVRMALEAHPEFAGQRRDRLYEIFSGHAAHASYKGFALTASAGEPKLGAFFDEKLLRALLEDLGTHLSHAALCLGMFFDDVDVPILLAKAAYIDRLRQYHEKYNRPAK